MSARSDTDILAVVITARMSRLALTTLELPQEELDAGLDKTLTIRGLATGVSVIVRAPHELHAAPMRVQ
jgi:hypothetical protein